MYHMLCCTNTCYHIIARTFVYFTPLHTLYIFSDYNAFNIQFWTCNRDVNMVAAVIFFLLPRSI